MTDRDCKRFGVRTTPPAHGHHLMHYPQAQMLRCCTAQHLYAWVVINHSPAWDWLLPVREADNEQA